MRKIALLLLLIGIALPVYARQVTLAELEQVLASAQGKSDSEVARMLSDLELTERMSTAQLVHWQQQFPGTKARQSILAIADASAFLQLPAAESPAPRLAIQRQIMSLVATYVADTIHQLPNFFARQLTTHFEDQPMRRSTAASPAAIYKPLHATGASTVSNVFYSDGREVIDPGPVKVKKSEAPVVHLKTQGVFGPILQIVLIDAAQNKLVWSHWEQADAGQLAVFGYSVPQEKSRYQVTYCCVPDPKDLANPQKEFRQLVGYHGEIAVEPATGVIRRITMQADLKPSDPLSKADLLVEYAPVDIGGFTYTCPAKSISISRALLDTSSGISAPVGYESSSWRTPIWQTYLNDVQFQEYHLFHATTKIVPVEKASTAGGNGETAVASASVAERAPTPAADSAVAETILAPAPTAPPPPPAVVEAPEYSLAPLDKPPFTTSTPDGFVIKTTARLVDVGFVAYDKHGKPVTDLKQDEVAVFDNGVRQQLRLFFQAAPATPSAVVAAVPVLVTPESFSNQPVAVSATVASPIAPSTTVLLIDAAHLPWADLRAARDATIKFLNKLNPAQPVAIYTMDDIGFHVLVEMTQDHSLLAAKLKSWTPSAATVSNAQEAQERNTRHIDEVQNPSDLQTVNGNRAADADSAGDSASLGGVTMPLDTQLRDFGANPGRESLRVLIAIARHLAPVPGHKSLIWVSGDAAMADFGDQVSLTGPEKNQSKYLNEIANSAGEALNQAHVALYALDASAIEAGGVDASLYGMAVSLNPTTPTGLGATPTSGHMGSVPGNARASEQMQNDMHGIQEPIRRVAESTGGKALRRASDIGGTLDSILRDTQATYMASFTPDSAPDGTFHKITLKVTSRQGITLRYRSGYYFEKESTDPRAKFQQAVWQPVDPTEIGLTAKIVSHAPAKVQLMIALKDLTMDTQGDRRTGKVDIYLIQREEYGGRANSSGEAVKFDLKPATYASMLTDGFAYQRSFNPMPKVGSIRLIVFDENSGRTGSVTLPVTALQP